jgi:hypothetical protein
VRRKLRVYLRSEHLHQKNAADAAEPPSWVLTLSGRLVGSKDKGGVTGRWMFVGDVSG